MASYNFSLNDFNLLRTAWPKQLHQHQLLGEASHQMIQQYPNENISKDDRKMPCSCPILTPEIKRSVKYKVTQMRLIIEKTPPSQTYLILKLLTWCMKAAGNWWPLGVLVDGALLHWMMSTNSFESSKIIL